VNVQWSKNGKGGYGKGTRTPWQRGPTLGVKQVWYYLWAPQMGNGKRERVELPKRKKNKFFVLLLGKPEVNTCGGRGGKSGGGDSLPQRAGVRGGEESGGRKLQWKTTALSALLEDLTGNYKKKIK